MTNAKPNRTAKIVRLVLSSKFSFSSPERGSKPQPFNLFRGVARTVSPNKSVFLTIELGMPRIGYGFVS